MATLTLVLALVVLVLVAFIVWKLYRDIKAMKRERGE